MRLTTSGGAASWALHERLEDLQWIGWAREFIDKVNLSLAIFADDLHSQVFGI